MYRRLLDAGLDALLYDRDERPGVLFAEADLIGVPHRVVIGERGLEQGTMEYKHRAGQDVQKLAPDELVRKLADVRAGH
jgi:prolyl-tRNA synthetase